MAYLARIERAAAELTVVDDRGIPARTVELGQQPTDPHEVEDELVAVGFTRSAAWTETGSGWEVPVVARADG